MDNSINNPGRKRNIRPAIFGLMVLLVILGALLVWLNNVSVTGDRVVGCPTGCAQDSDQDDGLITILSLNMLHGFPGFENLSARVAFIINQIQQLDADIVLMQEVPWGLRTGNLPRQFSDDLGMNYLYYRANGNRSAILFEEGELILSRLPLMNAGYYELKPKAGTFEHRVVLHADVVTPGGKLGVFVTHLTNGEPVINRLQTESLLDYVNTTGDQTKIIAGDFNAVESSPQIITLAERWIDAYRQLNSEEKGFTCCIDNLTDDPSEPLEKRIDYIFVTRSGIPEITLLEAQRVFNQPERTVAGWQWASDHIGVMVKIKLAR